MKKFSYVLGSGVLLSLAILGTLTGCGGLECADGLVAQDGECVLEEEVEGCEEGKILKDGECVDPESLCDEDTVYDDSLGACVLPYDKVVCGDNTVEDGGQCVAQRSRDCGSGTALDVNTNECVVTDKNCGEFTEFTEIDGQHVCLPTDEVCGEGTEFSEDAGLCLPDFDCQPGDVVIDGYCVPEVAQLIEDADYEATGNTNPDLGGTPVSMDVADVGETTIFTGVIGEPADINGDGELDQVIDVFEFEAQEGDWFEVSVRSVGLPNPAFAVRSEGDNSFERYSALGTERDKIRQIVIPEEGTYQIAVFPESLLTGGDFLLGDDDWDYAATLELMETPEADEHNFLEENLESEIGRLDRNFYVADQFEPGKQASFTWEKKPEYTEALATVWASPDEFIGEFDEDSFGVEVPESGEIFIVFDWELRQGNVGLDFEVSAEELLILEDGQPVTETVSADEGDVLYLEQSNDSGADVDVAVADDNAESIFDTSVSSKGLKRYVALPEGEYDVTFENSTGERVEGFDFEIDVVTPTEITDFEEEITGTVNENIAGEQDYYLIHLDERQAFEIDLERNDGFGFLHMFIYELENTELLSQGPSDVANMSTHFEFEAETTYVLRIGGEYETSADEYEYTLAFDELSSVPEGGEMTESFSADDGDVVEITQTNLEGAEVMVTVTDDDSGAEVVSDTLSDGGTLQHYPLDAGDYTATFTNEGEDSIYSLNPAITLISPIDAKTFTADAGEPVRLSQENNSSTTVDLFVIDEQDEVVIDDSLTTWENLEFYINNSGDHSIYYFQSGEPADEQEVAGIEFTVQFKQSTTLETVNAELGDAIDITRDDSASPVNFEIVDDDGNVVASENSVGYNDLFRYIGVEKSGYHDINVVRFGDEAPDASDYDLNVHVEEAMEAEPGETYSGTVEDGDQGDQDYYLVELDETTTYDVDLQKTGGGAGYAHLMVYALGGELLAEDGPNSYDSATVELEFEADTPYVIRVGGTADPIHNEPYDYDLIIE